MEKELRRGFFVKRKESENHGKGPVSDERMQGQDDAEELLSMKRHIFHLEPWPGFGGGGVWFLVWFGSVFLSITRKMDGLINMTHRK